MVREQHLNQKGRVEIRHVLFGKTRKYIISGVIMSSSKRHPAPKLQTLIGKNAFGSLLQAAGVRLEQS